MLALVLVACGGDADPPASAAPSLIAPINSERIDDELAPLTESDALERLAGEYLALMLEQRCLCPPTSGNDAAERLLTDTSRVLEVEEAEELRAGLALAYDISFEGAIAGSLGITENTAVLLDPSMTHIGVASATIPPGSNWLAPPPGGDGPDIDLTGYVLVVIVTAGTGT